MPSHSSSSSSGPPEEYFCERDKRCYNSSHREATYVDFTKETSHIDDIILQEIVEDNHVQFLAKEDVISKILYDLRNDHQPSANHYGIVLRNLNIDYFRGYDGWRDESI